MIKYIPWNHTPKHNEIFATVMVRHGNTVLNHAATRDQYNRLNLNKTIACYSSGCEPRACDFLLYINIRIVKVFP